MPKGCGFARCAPLRRTLGTFCAASSATSGGAQCSAWHLQTYSHNPQTPLLLPARLMLDWLEAVRLMRGMCRPLQNCFSVACHTYSLSAEHVEPACSCGKERKLLKDASVSAVCPQCGQAVAASEMQQHRDYHFAEKLASDPGGGAASHNSRAGTRVQRQAGGQTITKFFRPSKAPRQGCG